VVSKDPVGRPMAKAAATTARIVSLEGLTVYDKLPPYR
jgi:hypothetical protein